MDSLRQYFSVFRRECLRVSSQRQQRLISRQSIGGVSSNFFAYMCQDASLVCREILGVKIHEMEKGRVLLGIKYNSHLSGNPSPESMHGGVIAALIDHAGGFSAWSTIVKVGSFISTVDLRIEYHTPLLISDKGNIYFGTLMSSIVALRTPLRSYRITTNG
jgi:uncharacterized protein (TIGR00369 family)